MKVLITRKIPTKGIDALKAKGWDVVVSPHARPLTKEELIEMGKGADAVMTQLVDKIDGSIIDGWGGSVKIVANYAVGYDNLNTKEIAAKGVAMTNTPGALTDSVSEFAFTLLLSIAHRVPESDRFSRAGKYKGWEPELLLGADVAGKTLGIVGLGRIGSRVGHIGVRGFGMKAMYYDVNRNEQFEKEYGVEYCANVDDVLKRADFVSIHVPLLDSTRHLINKERLAMMKSSAYLVNTSRGPVVDEAALRDALKAGVIRGAAIDVWEFEPKLTAGLEELENIIITPHTASATEETRQAMGEIAAHNIIEALEGRTPPNLIKSN